MTLITKTTYVDNLDSELKGFVEIGIRGKKAFVERKTCKVINRDNINNLERYQAFKLALSIAKDYLD